MIAGDVDNPLLGPTGAAAVYAPQKGASPADVAVLETGLQRWAEIVCATTGQDLSSHPGAGAAGGVGFAALTFLHATPRPGIELILDLVGFDDLLTGVALVVTGEGSLDEQSLNGKAPVGVAAAAARQGIPTVAVAGRSLLTAQQISDAGFSAVYTLLDREPDITICLAQAGRLLEELAAEITASLPPERRCTPTRPPPPRSRSQTHRRPHNGLRHIHRPGRNPTNDHRRFHPPRKKSPGATTSQTQRTPYFHEQRSSWRRCQRHGPGNRRSGRCPAADHDDEVQIERVHRPDPGGHHRRPAAGAWTCPRFTSPSRTGSAANSTTW